MERLGKKKYAIPVVICVMVSLVLSLMLFPMIHMQLKGLPIAVVSEDAGAETPAGPMVIGNQVVDTMIAMNDTAELPFVWTEVDDQNALDIAMDNGDYYAALIIPEDFTASNMAGQPAALTLVIDHAQSPMVASLLGPMLKTQLELTGMKVELQALHAADFESEFVESNPVAAAIGQQAIIATLVVMSMLSGVIITLVMGINRKDDTGAKFKTVAQQVVYGLVISLIAATFEVCIVAWTVGVSMPLMSIFVICWIASWCLIVFMSGLSNIHPVLGLLMALTLVSAMFCGILPVEALPEFWQNWIAPWAPQMFLGEALRATLFADLGIVTPQLMTLFVFPAIGLVLSALSVFIPGKDRQVA